MKTSNIKRRGRSITYY